MAKPNFTITVNDTFCDIKYPLNLGSDYSIDMVMETIYKAFNLPKETGELNSEIVTLEKKIASLKATIETRDRRIENLEDRIGELEDWN